MFIGKSPDEKLSTNALSVSEFHKSVACHKKCFENTNPFIGFLLFFLKKVKKPFLGPKISCVHFAAFVDISLGERANYWPIWAANGCSSNLHGQQKKRGGPKKIPENVGINGFIPQMRVMKIEIVLDNLARNEVSNQTGIIPFASLPSELKFICGRCN